MTTKSSRFDALATVLYTEHEVLPSTMSLLKEDSFAAVQDGYTPDDWSKIPYRKRRYITLRNRARVSGATGGSPLKAAKAAAAPIVAPPSDEEDLAGADTAVGGDEGGLPDMGDIASDITNQAPAAPVVQQRDEVFTDAMVEFISDRTVTTRAELASYLETAFGDRLHTDAQINKVINTAVKNGDIILNGNNTVSVGNGEADAETSGPSDAELARLAADETSVDKKKQRSDIYKRLMAWRAMQKAGLNDVGSSEEGGKDDEDEDERALPADQVIGKGRLSKSGADDVDWEASTGQED